MNRKNIPTIVVLSIVAALLPAVAIMSQPPSGIYSHSMEANRSLEEVMDISKIVVKGTIIDSKVEIVKGEREGQQDVAFTIWSVKPTTTYKGSDSDIVTFKTIGGKLSEGVYTGSSVDLHHGDQVIVMLDKSPKSIYGDENYVVSIQQGLYTIDKDGIAKSTESFIEVPENALEQRISNYLR
ncbi:hypothetical protein K0U27_01905 [archaeon]|nr:hypothetical protein [archaeon]